MSDEAFLPPMPPLMSAVRARDLARMHKGMAEALRQAGDPGGARLLEHHAQWWVAYAIALSHIPPGASKPEWEAMSDDLTDDEKRVTAALFDQIETLLTTANSAIAAAVLAALVRNAVENGNAALVRLMLRAIADGTEVWG